MPNLDEIQRRELTPETRICLVKLIAECERFEPCSQVLREIEDACVEGRFPTDKMFDDLVLDLTRHLKSSNNTKYTVGYIIQHIIYEWTENSGVGEYASVVDYSLFNIDDPEQGYAHHRDKVDLRFIDYD